MDFGSIATVPAVTLDATVATIINTRLTDNIVRVGVNYKFDQLGPIVTKF